MSTRNERINMIKQIEQWQAANEEERAVFTIFIDGDRLSCGLAAADTDKLISAFLNIMHDDKSLAEIVLKAAAAYSLGRFRKKCAAGNADNA